MKLIKSFVLSALAVSSINAFAAQTASPITHTITVSANNNATCEVSGTPTTSVVFDLSTPGVKNSDVTFAIACNTEGLTPNVKATDASWTVAGGAPADAVAIFATSTDGTTYTKVGTTTGADLTEGTTAAGVTPYAFAQTPKMYFGAGTVAEGGNVSGLTAPSRAAGAYADQTVTLTVTF